MHCPHCGAQITKQSSYLHLMIECPAVPEASRKIALTIIENAAKFRKQHPKLTLRESIDLAREEYFGTPLRS